jgi:hypothetical protein
MYVCTYCSTSVGWRQNPILEPTVRFDKASGLRYSTAQSHEEGCVFWSDTADKREASMSSRNWRRIAALILLSVAAIWTGGCSSIQIIDRTPSTVQPRPSLQVQEIDEHNLAVLAVDFDPPLEYREILAARNRGEGITLLVAVENTGSVIERDVVVEVELYRDGGGLILHQEGSVEAIAPGEIKLVRFKDAEIPFSYRYQLKVHVLPVEGEVRLADNIKSYDLLVTGP